MMKVRKSQDRGYADHGWLKSQHTFSFAEYYDPEQMGFGPLRVINEDRIEGAMGFETHPHSNMEIISYVLEGELRHKDSMGNVAIIKPGEVQRMSAGTGVQHSEFNNLNFEETHFFQIWIRPNELNVAPGYGQKSFLKELNSQKVVHVISPDGRDGSISIHQDANMYISRLQKDDFFVHTVPTLRRCWVQVAYGELKINDQILNQGDALAVLDIDQLSITALEASEFIIFDLP